MSYAPRIVAVVCLLLRRPWVPAPVVAPSAGAGFIAGCRRTGILRASWALRLLALASFLVSAARDAARGRVAARQISRMR